MLVFPQIYHDRSLFGHAFTDFPRQVRNFSRSQIVSQHPFVRSCEGIIRRLLAPFISLITSLSVLPLGFIAKVLHYTIRSCLTTLFRRTAFASFILASPVVITFQSPDQLKQALLPHSIQEVEARIASSTDPLAFNYESRSLETKPAIPHRSAEEGNMLGHPVFRSNQLTVYYPESPRVPHHLAIALNRPNICGMTDVSEQETQDIFSCIKQIAEIYNRIHITGFVITQYDRSQQGHRRRYVVEVIPHLPGFNNIKNIADKVDCNRHVLFRHANISPVVCAVARERIEENARFWKRAFKQEALPLTVEDTTISFPHSRHESHEQIAQKILKRHLIEILQDGGGQIEPTLSSAVISMPTEVPQHPKSVEVSRCPFCDPKILRKQRVLNITV